MAESFRDWLQRESEAPRWRSKIAFARALGEPYDNLLRWLYRNVVPRRGIEKRLAEVTGRPMAEIHELLAAAREEQWVAMEERIQRRRQMAGRPLDEMASKSVLDRKDLARALPSRLVRTDRRSA